MTNPQDARRPEILVEGGTCWRVRRARRAAFLIDGEHYFAALADALERAQRQVWLVGWDFHSALRLRRDEPAGEGGGCASRRRPADLASLLDALVRERRELEVHVLAWDFTMLYALDREFLPLLQFGARTHRRVHFAMDAAHALGASQHQKLVVIDDAIAFVGGLDLTAERWDTRAHRADEPGRVRPGGGRYPPFHDFEVAFDGEAARAMGALARDRWRRATGTEVPAVGPGLDAWPTTLEADVEDVRIGIARTRAAYEAD